MERVRHLFSFFTPGAIARTAVGLPALAARRPALFAQLLLAGLRDRRELIRLLRLPIDLEAIRNSPLFDGEWYLRNHPGLSGTGLSPELHYLLDRVPSGRWASPQFSGDEYLGLNPEVRASGMNPLAHYELYGRFIGCPATRADAEPLEPSFPGDAREIDLDFPEQPPDNGRTAVYASYSPDGRIPERDILYLRGLREVCDNTVFAANSPLLPGEAERLRGLASSVVGRWHGGYDFGSYRVGLGKARERGWLAPERCRELVFANSSCYGPVRPFSEMFGKMGRRRCDFWGLTFNTQRSVAPHLQSFFLVFRRPVLDAGALGAFFAERPEHATREEAINLFEIQLTAHLRRGGFVPDAFVRPWFPRLHEFNPTTRPITLIRRHRSPLVKVKALRGESSQPPERVLALVRRLNPELGAAMRVSEPPAPRVRLAGTGRIRREAKLGRIMDALRAGKPIRALFLVSNPSMFPARPLFMAMRRDPAFEARITAIPDLRWPDRDPVKAMAACERELGAAFPGAMLPPMRPSANGDWPDVVADFRADIVCHPLPYDFSEYHYNPGWVAGADVLPIYSSYSFSTSRHGFDVYGLQNYAYFWKVFTECEMNAREYAGHSVLKGANAETTGYFKMDALATANPWPRNGDRRRVLIAPHHSVDGGANDALALSNFQRYADYFLALPEKHPELDFVFRPHPFLFTVLAHPAKWGQAKVDAWISRMKAHPNVRWSDEGDYFPAFVSCDAIVHDCGSFLAEWFYTGKPCCYMLKFPSDIDEKFTPLGKECLSHCHLAYDEAAIEAFIHDVVENGNDPKAPERDEFRRTIMVNYPHAADAALAAIKENLKT